MGRIDNLNNSNIPEIWRAIRSLQNATPMNHSAVGRGGIEIYDQGVLNISDGSLIVNGTATISGVLNADGTVTLSGVIGISGPLTVTGTTALNGPTTVGGNLDVNGKTTLNGDTTVTGPAHINGATDINGNLTVDGTAAINGAATLNNDLTVQGGGKIKAGVTQLNPDGTLSMGGGKRITPDNGTGSFAIESGASSIQLTPSNPDYWAQFSGGAYFQGLIRGMGLKLAGLPTTTEPANLNIAADGTVRKSTA